ncbi:MAG: M20/M25/M40 family metallo-hydrolase [Lachnospiraceae bacterium]|nr:M20/M25/M40 family metallo-hydrolase [Lachnospiraceae bacterium]
MNEVLKAIAAKYKDAIVETAQELIRRNSQSNEEAEVAAYVTAKMKELGYDEVITDRYGSVFGVVKGSGGGSSVGMNCHMDVVDEGDRSAWKYPPYSGEIAEGRIWGRGASDTKGTMAIQIYTPIMLREAGMLPKGDVITSCVVCEEIAGFGSMMQCRDEFMLTDYAIIGEASENDLAIGSRGRCCPYITIKGKSCHASIPHTGHNPIDYLEKLLPKLKEVEMADDPLFGPSTMTVTRIDTPTDSKNLVTNIVPGTVIVYMDYRQVGDDTVENVKKKIQAVMDQVHVEGVTAELNVYYFPMTTYTGFEGMGYQGEEPFSVSPEEDFVQKAKAAIEAAVGHEIQTKAWAFATDTGHFTSKGVKCIGYSPAEIKLCHTAEDSISLEMMDEGIVGYLALVKALADTDK